MAMPLDGRTAVVTGGGRGIGAATARALARAGAAVIVAARTPSEINAVAEELQAHGRGAWALPCDVTDPTSVRDLARTAADRAAHVDILINSAGAASSNPLHKLTLDEWNAVFAANATGTFLVTQAFLAGMVERGWGRVVNIASVAGLAGAKYIAAYAAAKHAVIGFTRSVAAEVAARGVTVNAVCPGYVDTAMTERSLARIRERTGMSQDQALQAILATTPQRRLITPAEVAHAVLSLCAAEAEGITGQAIVIDGGGLLA